MNRKLKMVHWLDSGETPRWVSATRVDPRPAKCVSVGYVVHETKVAITLALTVRVDEGYDDVCSCMTIPRISILKMRSIK